MRLKAITHSRTFNTVFSRIFLFLVILASCRTENDPAISDKSSSVYSYILSLGIREDLIEDKGDYYLVAQQARFAKNGIYSATQSDDVNSAGRTTQYQTGNDRSGLYGIVSRTAVANIRVGVGASIPSDGGPDDWHAAIQQAIADYNAINKSIARFTYVTTGPTDIFIKPSLPGELGDNTIFQFYWPSGGLPGYSIEINLAFNSNMTMNAAQKRNAMDCILGRCIGIGATNWTSTNTPPPMLRINGTPCSDANSLFNDAIIPSTLLFSPADQTAIQMLYPIDRPANTTPIYGYYINSEKDHFYAINWSELGCGSSNNIVEGVYGYIFNTPISGASQIYRYYSASLHDHFYYTYSTPPNGAYTSEGTMGWAYTTQMPGTVPFYRYYSASFNDHFYTPNLGTYPGYVYETIAWYIYP